MAKTLRSFIGPAIGATIGSVIPGVGTSIGAALGSGTQSYTKYHNIGKALLSGGGSYLGGQIAGNVLGSQLGTVGGAINSTLGSSAANAIGSGLANTTFSSILGSSLGSDLASGLVPDKAKNPRGEGAAPFKPSQAAPLAMPASLASLSTLTPAQQASNIASNGVYGGGQGPQENSYFLNLVNRQMFDDAGNQRGLDAVNPIENSYLKQLGISGYGNSTDLLRQIQGWHA